MITKQCLVCGTEFKVKSSRDKKGHGKYCSKKCKDKHASKKVERVCNTCHKKFEVTQSRIRHNNVKYCSIVCRGVAKRNRQSVKCIVCGKVFEATLSQIEDGRKACSLECARINRKTKVKKRCKACGKEFEASNFEVLRNRAKYCSRACYWVPKKQVKKKCIVCGKAISILHSYLKYGRGKFCSQSCRGVWYIRNHKYSDTDIEVKLKEWLTENNIAFTPQYPTAYALVDFFILPNICLFADGDYWHTKDEQAIKKDKYQTKKLEQLGYKVIRLWGSEIKQGKRPIEIIDYHNNYKEKNKLEGA